MKFLLEENPSYEDLVSHYNFLKEEKFLITKDTSLSDDHRWVDSTQSLYIKKFVNGFKVYLRWNLKHGTDSMVFSSYTISSHQDGMTIELWKREVLICDMLNGIIVDERTLHNDMPHRDWVESMVPLVKNIESLIEKDKFIKKVSEIE